MNKIAQRPSDVVSNLEIGNIIEVDGTHIIAELNHNLTELSKTYSGDVYPIGQYGSLIKIHFGRRIIYAIVGRLRLKSDYQAERGIFTNKPTDERIIEADLLGEGEWILETSENGQNTWKLLFDRGVSTYPLPQQKIYLTPTQELKFIYGQKSQSVIKIGCHVGSGDTACYANINELLGKHTAVLGSTGSGKSAAVSAIIHGVLDRGSKAEYEKWNPRIIILDPHGEYQQAFKNAICLSTDNSTLTLPYWVQNFQETLSLLIGKTEFVATSQSNIVKSALLFARKEGAQLLKIDDSKISVDSPIPYKLSTLKSQIEQDRPSQQSKQDSHNSILQKLEVLQNDARLNFMMNEWDEQDSLVAIIENLVSCKSKPLIVDFSGIPNEVAGITSAVIARILFNLKVWQKTEERQAEPVLLVCEEAHRYVPNIGEAQYDAAQEAIRRIAKEGRKYGVGLMLVSQRPSEIESTVLSQCNSWLVLRITNETDRSHVKSILPDSLAGFTQMLSGLRKREAIFVGEAAMVPSRILINKLSGDELPNSNDIDFDQGWQMEPLTSEQIGAIVERWRFQSK